MTQAPTSYAPSGVEINGAAVREARKRAGMTLTMLAERVDLTVGYLSQIERGKKPTVSPPAFVRIAGALQLDNLDDIRAGA
jgi:transcriptional regulator with XRE-family HTH domain